MRVVVAAAATADSADAIKEARGAFQPGLIVTVKLICAQMAMRWEEQAEERGASAVTSGV